MNWLRRVKPMVARDMPETKTEDQAISKRPPITQIGMEAKRAPNSPKMPSRISQKAHEKPTERLAQLVSAIRPLFCEKVVLGGEPNTVAKNELIPSARMPPWMREEMSSLSLMRE